MLGIRQKADYFSKYAPNFMKGGENHEIYASILEDYVVNVAPYTGEKTRQSIFSKFKKS